MKLFSGLLTLPGMMAAAALSMFPNSAFAWDGVLTGRITNVEVSVNGENYGFRVHFAGQQACGTGSPSWSYLNKSATNYDAMVSMLTSSFLNGKPVTLYTTKVGQFCEIGHAAFQS